MKRIMRLLLPLVLLVNLAGCGHWQRKQYGYPETVKFSKNGGEKDITGETDLPFFDIRNKPFMEDGKVCASISAENYKEGAEVLYLKYDWLTVIHLTHTHEVTLIAEPNKTKKKRKLHIVTIFAYNVMQIDVVQDK
ncbi:MAG: hypothetical protein HDR93_02820 [Bacteroides sp.]|nr:hypothetical protein [Bacteroides sp.]